MTRRNYIFVLAALVLAAAMSAGAQSRAMTGRDLWAQITPPENLPNVQDALDNAFQSIHIRVDSSTLQKLNVPPRNILERLGNWWLGANAWFEEHVGVSLRAIIRFVGYVFIWIAVLWIKLIQWLLSLI